MLFINQIKIKSLIKIKRKFCDEKEKNFIFKLS